MSELYDLITDFDDIDLDEFVKDSRLIMVEFDQRCSVDARNACSFMLLHLIDMSSMEIVTYSKQIQSINTVIDNYRYCNGLRP